MTTPKHTYTYSRMGVGDVMVLAPEGHPYTITPAIPQGWFATFWYATDRLASIHDFAKWTQFTPPGTVPAGANKVAVNIEAIPDDLVPDSVKAKCTMETDNYKAAAGLQYTDSGGRNSAFIGPSRVWTPPDAGNLLIWLDFADESTVFSDTAGTIPAVAGVDAWHHITNKGTLGGFFSIGASELDFKRDPITGLTYCQSGDGREQAVEPHNLDFTILAGEPFSHAATCFGDGTNFDNMYEMSRGGGNLSRITPRNQNGIRSWTAQGNDPFHSAPDIPDHPFVDDEWVSTGWGVTHNTLLRHIMVGVAVDTVDFTPLARNEMVNGTSSNHQMMDTNGGIMETLVWESNVWEGNGLAAYKAYVNGRRKVTYPYQGVGIIP